MRRFGKESAYKSLLKPLLVYSALSMFLFFISLPYMHLVHKDVLVSAAFIGIWRYSVMLLNYIRAYIYSKKTYPNYLKQIEKIPEEKRYPEHLYVIVPSYKEDAWITTEVFQTLMAELNQLPCKSTIVVSTATKEEDSIIRNVYDSHPAKDSISIILQKQSEGKRIAMGYMLRAVAKEVDIHNHTDSITVFMDGDTYLPLNTLKRSLPIFKLDSNLGAVTTNEVAYINSESIWYKEWFNLKFAQRHVLFQSQAMSKRVMTLTGRFSIFRTSAVITEDFISTIERDILVDSSYGKFRFLMGDDKSSWYNLMKNNYNMLYLPDILIYPLESRDAKFLNISTTLPFRWYGNTLRNNARARKLKNQPIFIKYLLLDQVILMWTSLVGVTAALLLGLFVNFVYIPLYLSWIIIVRLIQMSVFVYFGHRVSIYTLPIMLYSQWIGALIKIKSYFYLAEQKWSKSGNEEQNANKDVDFIKYSFFKYYAPYRMYLYIALFIFFILTAYTEIFTIPKLNILKADYEPSRSIILQAIPNDNKDDAKSLNKLIKEAKDYSTIILPSGTLDIYEPIIIKRSHITIIGNNTILLSHLKGNYKNILTIAGERDNYIGKTSESMNNHIHTKISTKYPIKQKEILLIEEDNDYNYVHNILGSQKWYKKYPKLRSEIVEVANFKNQTLTTSFKIKSLIDKDASIYKINPVTDITLKNITIDSIYKSKKYNYIYKNSEKDLMIDTIHILYGTYINLENINIYNSGSSPLVFERTFHCSAKNIKIDGAINKGKKGNGYLRFNKAFHNNLKNISVKHIRHIVFQWASAYNKIDNLYTEVDINFHGGSSHDNIITNIVYNVNKIKHKWGDVYRTPKDASWAPPDLGSNITKEKL